MPKKVKPLVLETPTTLLEDVIRENGGITEKITPRRTNKDATVKVKFPKEKRSVIINIENIEIKTVNQKRAFRTLAENTMVLLPYRTAMVGLTKKGNKIIFTLAGKGAKDFKMASITVAITKNGEVKVDIKTDGSDKGYKFAKTIADYVIGYAGELF